jgi:hypothetical protein
VSAISNALANSGLPLKYTVKASLFERNKPCTFDKAAETRIDSEQRAAMVVRAFWKRCRRASRVLTVLRHAVVIWRTLAVTERGSIGGGRESGRRGLEEGECWEGYNKAEKVGWGRLRLRFGV